VRGIKKEISQVLYIVILYSKRCRTLTFEIFFGVSGFVRMCVAVLWPLEKSLIKKNEIFFVYVRVGAHVRGRVVGAGGIADKVLVGNSSLVCVWLCCGRRRNR